MHKPLILTICIIVALGSAYLVYAGVLTQVKSIPAAVTVVLKSGVGGQVKEVPAAVTVVVEAAAGSPPPASVGGATSFQAGGSGSSSGRVALLAGGVAAGLAVAVTGGWYARTRRLKL